MTRTLIADRQRRYERTATRRRVLRSLRQRLVRSTPVVEVAVAAQAPIVLGRTPSPIERRAA
jgi:hypothetical protein